MVTVVGSMDGTPNPNRSCEACQQTIGLSQAAFTSECSTAHRFHLRCVSGIAVCPVCAARWRYKPVVAAATAPASAFSFPHPPAPAFSGQPAATSTTTSAFGSHHPTPVEPQSLCAVCCHRLAVPGDRGGIITSECSHMFHLGCLSSLGTVSDCLVCKARWRDSVAARVPSSPFGSSTLPPSRFSSLFGSSTLPSGRSPSPPFGGPGPPPPFGPSSSPSGFPGPSPSFCPGPWPVGPSTSPFGSSPVVYDDDEPVEAPPPADDTAQEAASNLGELVLKTHCKHPAIARGTPHEKFAVLVHAKAPSAAAAPAARAPLDLVALLDVSGSMEGAKLALVQAAMGFVIDMLGPDDRLSIVSFSYDARRVMPLTRMSGGGKASAMRAVWSLPVYRGTVKDIHKGLAEVVKVLDGRRYRNTVTSVVLLSDGEDTTHLQQSFNSIFTNWKKNPHELVPRALLRSSGGSQRTPIHTFGFGTDHYAAAMHTIAEATGGTFSFIENHAAVQDAFKQCIGGLLPVAVQEAWISVTCPDVRVRAVKSGRYESRVEAYGRAASVDVGDLYADEERRFLLFVDVPIARDGEGVTRLVKVTCTYRDAVTGRLMDVAGEDAVVERPVEVTGPQEPSMEVELERFRVEITEDIAAARAAAERREHAEAARILDRRQEALRPDLAGDARCAALVAELRELQSMVKSSQKAREQQQKQPAKTPFSMPGSLFAPSGNGNSQLG